MSQYDQIIEEIHKEGKIKSYTDEENQKILTQLMNGSEAILVQFHKSTASFTRGVV